MQVEPKNFILKFYFCIKRFFSSLITRYKIFKIDFDKLPSSTPTNSITHSILWATLAILIIFLIWAKFAVLEEVTEANATVITTSHIQSIQNMEGGIIKEIVVHEGDMVQKNQVLIYLDPTRFISSLKETQARTESLEIKIARLTAEVQKVPFVIDPKLRELTPTLVKNEQQLYDARQKQLQEILKNIELAQKELEMTQPLIKEGAASEVEVLHLQRQIIELDNQVNDFYAKAYSELETSKADLSTLKASLIALQDRLDRTTIRAPIKGLVKQIKLGTQEGVVLPGSEIMSIVPLEDNLLIEAQVKPSDIGFIHKGQPATVKITAYDYSIYGGVNGTVEQISADTITNEKGESYYLVRIKTEKNFLGPKNNPLYIIPGMTATVDILTGNKTVLEYLLSPLLKAKESALRER